MSEECCSAVLATGGYDHTVKLWKPHTGVCYWTAQHAESQVNDLALTCDKEKLAAAGFQHIRVYDVSAENNSLLNYEGISKNVTSVGFQEDCKWMYTTGEDHTARIWDLRCRGMRCCRMFQAGATVNYGILHPNQSELIMCSENGAIHFWDLRSDNSGTIFCDREASILCVSVDGKAETLSAVTNLGDCYIWKLRDKSFVFDDAVEPTIVHVHHKRALRCKISPDSRYIVTTSSDQTARIWDMQDMSLYKELSVPGGQRWVWGAEFTYDSQYLITVSSDGIGRLWNVKTGSIEREYVGHQKAIVALAFVDHKI